MRTMRSEANYFTDPKKVRSQRASKTTWISSLLASMLIAIIFVASLGLNPSVAFAADNDGFDSGPLENAFGDEADPQDLDAYFKQYVDGVETNTFQYVLGRLLIPEYINYLPQAVVAGNARSQADAIGFAPNGGGGPSNYICKTDQRGAGTPVYHNCDVPNFSAEFAQNLYALFDRSGPQNAYALNAASILFPKFGQSKALPGDSVPADTTGAPNKYTGLEVFGYDLQLSSYFGEWDHIQTMNQARLLTNFSFFDSVNLTAQSIGNAIGGAFNRAGAMSAEGWNTGGIFGAIGGFFSGLYEGGASGAINTMLDTSEANTVLTFGWYRANYSQTSYGLREMTNQEIVAQIRSSFLTYMNATMPEDMSYDQWLKSTDPGGAIMGTPPEPPIANCRYYTTPGGGEQVQGSDADPAPGITAEECDNVQLAADKAYFDANKQGAWSSGMSVRANGIVSYSGKYYQSNRSIAASTTAPSDDSRFSNVSSKISGGRYDLGNPDGGHGRGGWDKDGARPAQSFNEWYEAAKGKAGDWDGSISKYDISLSADACSPANGSVKEEAAARTAYITWLNSCWKPQWGPATERNEIESQTAMNTVWLTSLLTGSTLAKWSAENPGVFDFNSPWKRFVCLNADGSDVTRGTYGDTLSGGDAGAPILQTAFDESGNVSAACPQKQYRPPVQGGLFGDGYKGNASDQSPGNDTRHISNYYGPLVAGFYPFVLQPFNSVTQFLFTVGQFTTQLSNEIITWTYMPILESLQITTLVENLITDLRGGIFFPLAALVVAAAALYVLYQAGVRRRYREMFISVFYVALIFIIGVALMWRPGDVINIVDRVPANVEKAVMSLVLSPSINEDKICTTDSSASNSPTGGEAAWDELDITASSNAGSFTDIFSKGYNASDDSLRQVLCTNWKAFVYYPWVYAQWGTAPADLNSDAMQNTNQALVGDASVDLGGSNGVEKNWAVYQLKSMKLGSSTTVDWSLTGLNMKSKDFYRLVDLQAGPNNGAGTDSRFLATWSGMDPLSRFGVGLMSAGTAVVGFITVAAYSVTKILITFTSVFMLLLLPIVFLFGLFPTKRRFVRDYIFTILSLMLQRVALMLMIAVFLLLLMGVISNAENYLSVFMGALLICIVFLKFRKPIVDFALNMGGAGASSFGRLASNVNNFATGMVGVDGFDGMKSSWGQVGQATRGITPKSLRNYGDRVGAGIQNFGVGAVAGVITGGNPLSTGKDWAVRKDELLKRTQRRTGWGALEGIVRTKEQLEREAMIDAKSDIKLKQNLEEMQAELPEIKQYLDDLERYENAKSDLYRGIADGTITQTPVLDDLNQPMKDENGKPIIKYARVERFIDADTGEATTLEVEIELPKEPERPQLIDRELSLEELGNVRRYGEVSDQRKRLMEYRSKVSQQLYANKGAESVFEELSADASDSDINEVLQRVMPDSEGFTTVSRDRAAQLIKEIRRVDNHVTEIDKTLDKLSEDFAKKNSIYEYENNPIVSQAVVVESVTEQMEEQDRRGR